MFYGKQSLSTPNSVGVYVLVSLNLHAVAIGKKLQTKHWFDGRPKQRLEKNLNRQGQQSVIQTFGKAKIRMLKKNVLY